MSNSNSVTQIAMGVMLGNLGCFILWLALGCVTFLILNVFAAGLISSLTRSIR